MDCIDVKTVFIKIYRTSKWKILSFDYNHESYFVLQISQPPKIAQKWFCIQNLHMDFCFQEKKTIWKSNVWLPRNLQNKHCTIFFWNTLYMVWWVAKVEILVSWARMWQFLFFSWLKMIKPRLIEICDNKMTVSE